MGIHASLIKSSVVKYDDKGSLKIGDDELSRLFLKYADEYDFGGKFLDYHTLHSMLFAAREDATIAMINYWIKIQKRTGENLEFSIG